MSNEATATESPDSSSPSDVSIGSSDSETLTESANSESQVDTKDLILSTILVLQKLGSPSSTLYDLVPVLVGILEDLEWKVRDSFLLSVKSGTQLSGTVLTSARNIYCTRLDKLVDQLCPKSTGEPKRRRIAHT
jgi:hypothetical protein